MSQVLQSVLFETSPLDPATYAAAAAIVFTASLVAIAVPAHRATRVDPMLALRSE